MVAVFLWEIGSIPLFPASRHTHKSLLEWLSSIVAFQKKKISIELATSVPEISFQIIVSNHLVAFSFSSYLRSLLSKLRSTITKIVAQPTTLKVA
jgi:hypothetical protein